MTETTGTSTSLKADVQKYSWLVKPCPVYREEYKACSAFYAQFNSLYITGKRPDCTQWQTDYKSCIKYEQTGSEEARHDLIKSEKMRRLSRMQSSLGNDVWKYRAGAPEDWTGPIPEGLVSEEDGAFMQEHADKLKKGDSWCALM